MIIGACSTNKHQYIGIYVNNSNQLFNKSQDTLIKNLDTISILSNKKRHESNQNKIQADIQISEKDSLLTKTDIKQYLKQETIKDSVDSINDKQKQTSVIKSVDLDSLKKRKQNIKINNKPYSLKDTVSKKIKSFKPVQLSENSKNIIQNKSKDSIYNTENDQSSQFNKHTLKVNHVKQVKQSNINDTIHIKTSKNETKTPVYNHKNINNKITKPVKTLNQNTGEEKQDSKTYKPTKFNQLQLHQIEAKSIDSSSYKKLNHLKDKQNAHISLNKPIKILQIQPINPVLIPIHPKNSNLKIQQEYLREQTTIIKPLFIKLYDTIFINKTKIIKTKGIADTLNFTLYYRLGAIVPNDFNEIMAVLKKDISIKKPQMIFIKGYTDKSGNPVINKQITYKRIDYIIKSLDSIIDLKKIYIQNFADKFAKKKYDINERKIEIKLVSFMP